MSVKRDRGQASLQASRKCLCFLCAERIFERLFLSVGHRAFQKKALHQLTDDMLGIRAGAAVSADEDLTAVFIGFNHQRKGAVNIRFTDLELGISPKKFFLLVHV